MDEKTIRYPGHFDKIKTLEEFGLLDKETISVNGVKVAPRDVLVALLTPKLQLKEGEKDFTVTRVEVKGTKNGKKKQYTYDLIDEYDEEKNVTSMGRTTGYTGAIFAKFIGRGDIEKKGVIAPEEAIAPEKLFDEMAKVGMEIQER